MQEDVRRTHWSHAFSLGSEADLQVRELFPCVFGTRVFSCSSAARFFSTTLQQYAPWRHFQEEKERQNHVAAMIEEIYDDLQKEVKKGNDLTLSKSDMTVLLERKLGELPTSTDVEDLWIVRFRLPLVKWLE
jgi:hypothetical protein